MAKKKAASATMSRDAFLCKIEWEGGIEAAIDYGLKPTDCGDPEIASLWRDIVDWYNARPDAYDQVEGLVANMEFDQTKE